MLARIFLRQDARPRFVHPLIATGVIEVPVRVDQLLDGIGVDARDRLRNVRTRGDDFRIHEQLSIGAGQNGDISTSTQKNTYIPAKVLDGDLGCRGYLESSRNEHVARLGEQRSWRKPDSRSG